MFEIVSICRGGGYRYCRTVPPHPKANAKGLYPLHRVLMENKIGRLLGRDEHVHHIDEDKSNDAIENLELLAAGEHTKRHHKKAGLVNCICQCGKSFWLLSRVHRRRLRQNSGRVFCSADCALYFRRSKPRRKSDLAG